MYTYVPMFTCVSMVLKNTLWSTCGCNKAISELILILCEKRCSGFVRSGLWVLLFVLLGLVVVVGSGGFVGIEVCIFLHFW